MLRARQRVLRYDIKIIILYFILIKLNFIDIKNCCYVKDTIKNNLKNKLQPVSDSFTNIRIGCSHNIFQVSKFFYNTTFIL